MNIAEAIQVEVRRIRDMVAETKAVFPDGQGNFAIYEALCDAGDKAVREQDTTAMIRLLPQLKETE